MKFKFSNDVDETAEVTAEEVVELPAVTEAPVDDSPNAEDLSCAKMLTGSAEFYNFPDGVHERLVRFGLAAESGGMLMRGFRWFQKFN